VVPARARKPKDKAKVENAVQQVQRWVLAPLRERTFFSLAEANEAIASAVDALNSKLMKGPGLSRRELFEKEDLPAMRPLPERRYSYAEWKRMKLGPDYHVEVEGHLYSAPFQLVGELLEVRFSLATVEIFHGGKRVASHVRSLARRGFTTFENHMPERHRRQAEWTPERMLRWAASVGPNASAFAEALLASREHPEQGYRSLLGILRLEKQFDSERLDAACKRALANGALSYKSVRSILERRLEASPEQASLPSLPSHVNIRGGAFYSHPKKSCAN
jgi:transposase